MGPIYMVHPVHGTHIAYDSDEVERNKLNGWTLRDEVVPVIEEEPISGPPKKRGRPKGSKNKVRAD